MNFKTFVKLAVASCSTASVISLSTINAYAAEASNTASGGAGMGGMLISFGIIILFMYFVMIRPQKKKEKETKSMQDNIQIGDEIVTIGGIHGKVDEVKEHTVIVNVDHNTKIEFEKSAIIPNASQVGGAA